MAYTPPLPSPQYPSNNDMDGLEAQIPQTSGSTRPQRLPPDDELRTPTRSRGRPNTYSPPPAHEQYVNDVYGGNVQGPNSFYSNTAEYLRRNSLAHVYRGAGIYMRRSRKPRRTQKRMSSGSDARSLRESAPSPSPKLLRSPVPNDGLKVDELEETRIKREMSVEQQQEEENRRPSDDAPPVAHVINEFEGKMWERAKVEMADVPRKLVPLGIQEAGSEPSPIEEVESVTIPADTDDASMRVAQDETTKPHTSTRKVPSSPSITSIIMPSKFASRMHGIQAKWSTLEDGQKETDAELRKLG
ncbi:hypothetical protein BDV96DRAFT_644906 [Lophiotrema nucula]|uniref:Uncharacterized protein n=1 Tax=Lophiotrema nucula TaxID=690887 RepID=A0A6A5ZAI1_9PLEO|nr:hypothetical protein BDV96DRAFT_644906 [Lophiotrema nucula]